MPMSNLASTEDLFIQGKALPFPMVSLSEGLQSLHSADTVFPERQDLFGTISYHRLLVFLLFRRYFVLKNMYTGNTVGLSANLGPQFSMFSLNVCLQLSCSADTVFSERQDLFGQISIVSNHLSLILLYLVLEQYVL